MGGDSMIRKKVEKENRQITVDKITQMSIEMRKHALDMALLAGEKGAHLGGGLSLIEILSVLYGGVMNFDPCKPDWVERDRFILSKGHGVLAYYSALAEAGYFPLDELKTFELNESILNGHPILDINHGIEFSSGSLGMGLSFGLGIALSCKAKKSNYNVYVVLGDGECNEGSVWEAAMAAAHFKLGNLIAIVDRNNLQYDGSNDEIMDLTNFADKWKSFGWNTIELNGHDIQELYDALTNSSRDTSKPYVIIANTIKGKGISFMENQRDWHHHQLSQAQYNQAIEELKIKTTTFFQQRGGWND